MANLDLQEISSGASLDDTTLNNNINILNTVPLTGTTLNNIPTFSEDEKITAADINEAFTAIKNNWIDTSDATVAASDIAKDVTAYVNGEKITGNIETIESTKEKDFGDLYTFFSKNSDGNIQLKLKPESDILFRAGSFPTIYPSASLFGDATAADVAAGKTFTSGAGLRQTGTASNSTSEWELVFFSTDDTFPTSDIFSGTYELSNSYYKMDLVSNLTLTDFKIISFAGTYENSILTVSLSRIPEIIADGYFYGDNWPLQGFAYYEDEESWFEWIQASESSFYNSKHISISISGVNSYMLTPDNFYVCVAIKR